MDEADVESNGCLDLYGGGGAEDRYAEFQEDISYGVAMQDPRFAKSVLDRVQGMVYRDRNHGCVISWSLGNESGYGICMEEAARWVKAFDPSRILNYENAIWIKDGKLNDVSCLDVYKPDVRGAGVCGLVLYPGGEKASGDGGVQPRHGQRPRGSGGLFLQNVSV